MSEHVALGRPGRQRAAVAVWTTSLAATIVTLGLFGLDAAEPAGRSSSDVAPRLLFPLIAIAFATVAPMSVTVEAAGVGRYAQEVETAVCFCCSRRCRRSRSTRAWKTR